MGRCRTQGWPAVRECCARWDLPTFAADVNRVIELLPVLMTDVIKMRSRIKRYALDMLV